MHASTSGSPPTPEMIAAHALGVESGEVLAVERIKHGLTNDSWRVRTARDSVIVRLSNTAEKALRIDRQSEARVLSLVAAAGLGPEVLICDPARHVLVTRDMGRTWTEADAHLSTNVERIGALLRHLHALEIPTGVRKVDLVETVRGYLRELDEHDHRSELTAAAMRARAENAALALREDTECLCHNDVHSLNIVDNGSLRLIDWEYSGVGERMFDLASLCVYHCFDHQERERLLNAYLTHPSSSASSQLDLASWLFEYVRDIWMEVRARTRVDGESELTVDG